MKLQLAFSLLAILSAQSVSALATLSRSRANVTFFLDPDCDSFAFVLENIAPSVCVNVRDDFEAFAMRGVTLSARGLLHATLHAFDGPGCTGNEAPPQRPDNCIAPQFLSIKSAKYVLDLDSII